MRLSALKNTPAARGALILAGLISGCWTSGAAGSAYPYGQIAVQLKPLMPSPSGDYAVDCDAYYFHDVSRKLS